jgi:hypothetical protein
LCLVRTAGWELCAEGNARVDLLNLTEAQLSNERNEISTSNLRKAFTEPAT